MADIDMCHGDGCKFKDRCYRYTAQKSPCRQWYFIDVPATEEGCNFFISNEDRGR